MSILSSRPEMLAARVAVEGTSSKDDPSTASLIGLYGCTLDDPLLGGADDAAELTLTGTSTA